MQLSYPISSDFVSMVTVCPGSFKKALSAHCGATLTEARVLLCLANGEPLFRDSGQTNHSVATLQHDLRLGQTSVSSAITALERKGLVERVENPTDRRKLIILLTELGHAKVEHIDDVLAQAITDQWSGLDVDMQNVNYEGAEMFDRGRNKRTRTSDDEKNYDSSYFENNLEISALFKRLCNDYGLSGNGFRIMFELYQHPGGVSSSALSSKLLLHLNELSQACDRLVKQNYLIRTRRATDRRSVLLRLTAEGKKRLELVAPIVDHAFMMGFGNYEVPDESRRSYLRTAERVIAHQRRRFNPYAHGAQSRAVATGKKDPPPGN